MNYYERLRDLREDRDLSQAQIAEILNIRQSDYSKYELGKHMMGIDKYILLANYYNVSLDYLTGLTDVLRPIHLDKALSQQDVNLIRQYKSNPKWQPAVNKLLDLHEK